MIVSFAWTVPAVVLGMKDTTRRDWSPQVIRAAQRSILDGRTHKAYTKAPQWGGKHVANIRITEIIEDEDSRTIADGEWEREGFHVAQALGLKFDKDTSALDVWRFWRLENDQPQAVVRFELLGLTEEGEALAWASHVELARVGGPVAYQPWFGLQSPSLSDDELLEELGVKG